MKEMIIQAVDIGTTKVAAIVAKRTANNKLEILGIGTAPSYGVRRADVNNILRTVEAIKQAVAKAEEQSGIPFKEVFVGVAGSHVKSLQHRGILMRSKYNDIINQDDLNQLKKDMYKLALPPGDMIIEVLAQEYIVDGEPGTTDPIGMPGSRVEGNFHVITGSATAIGNIRRCVEDAGLIVKDVIMQPLASAAAVLTDEEKQAGVVLVDIGGGTTDVAVFVDGVIGHTAVIPFGGESITEDIRQGCNILKDTAEKLKTKHGSAIVESSTAHEVITIPGVQQRSSKEISTSNLSHIIQARMEEILLYVRNEIEISGLQRRLLAGLVLTGGGSKLKNAVQLTEFITMLETRIGLPNKNLAPSNIHGVDNQIYATGIGLIIKGMDKLSTENHQEPVVEKVVEKPTIVENTAAPENTIPVVLEINKPEPIVEEPMEKLKKEKQGFGTIFKSLTTRFVEFLGDDLADFSDTDRKQTPKK